MQTLPKKIRSRKLNSRVDLTAMVSVSFLLIIFFMVVGELSKPKIMSLALPSYDEDTCGWRGGCGAGTEQRTLTVLLDDNNEMIMYTGILEIPLSGPKQISYGKDGIRKELSIKRKAILEHYGDPNRDAIVIIKPSKKSNYGNLVNILDEMEISNISTYVIVNDFTPEETKLLASK